MIKTKTPEHGTAEGTGDATKKPDTQTGPSPVRVPDSPEVTTDTRDIPRSTPEGLEIRPFVVDITPPLGEVMDCGFDPSVAQVEHPLLAKGVVLRDEGETCVICAIDWGGLCNDTHSLFRQKIARAVGIAPSHVAVQVLHQHTAPCTDGNAQAVLNEVAGAPRHANPEYLERVSDEIAAAVKQAPRKLATQIGTGWAAVDRVASSRRIPQPDGTLLPRLSSTKVVEQQVAPEGVIDAFLRTVTFYDGDEPIARLHYYATHPQSYYGDGRVTYDVPGIARERLQQESGVFQVYFTGCGGNVAMGKYNRGTPEDRAALADRLYNGMKTAQEAELRFPVSSLKWCNADIQFTARTDGEFSEEACGRDVADDQTSVTRRIMAAMILAFRSRVSAGKPFDVSCLSIGQVKILHLPGEPFVEYQLWAQQYGDEDFVAVAGYGDCAMWYLCTDRAYQDKGGYEQTWSFVEPCEEMLKRTIAGLLDG